jgi:excisionase family DNA binding protein
MANPDCRNLELLTRQGPGTSSVARRKNRPLFPCDYPVVREVIAMPSNEPLIYRVPEVARVLGCTEAVARQMIARGQIPSRRLGRRVIVLREELLAHLDALGHPEQARAKD